MHRFPNRLTGSWHTQRGAVLFVSLIFLILLTLLALTATSTSILQERMTGGMRNRQLGLFGVETGLRGAEEYLWLLSEQMNYSSIGHPLPPCVSASSSECVHVPYKGVLDGEIQTFRTDRNWVSVSTDHSYARPLTGLTGAEETASLSIEPRFVVESLGLDLPPSAGGQGGGILPQPGQAGTHMLYRLTSRSQGGSDAEIRVAESVFSAADLINTGLNPGGSP